MRPLLAVGVIVVALGSVQAYITFVGSVTGGKYGRIELTAAEGRFHVNLTISFNARATVFEPESVLFKLHGGRTLLQIEEPVPAGTVLTIDPVEGIVEGENEFYLKVATGDVEIEEDAAFSLSTDDTLAESTAAAGPGGADKSRAVRIQVFRNDQLIVEKTIWSEVGQAVDGTVTVVVPAAGTTDDDDHEHARKGPA